MIKSGTNTPLSATSRKMSSPNVNMQSLSRKLSSPSGKTPKHRKSSGGQIRDIFLGKLFRKQKSATVEEEEAVVEEQMPKEQIINGIAFFDMEDVAKFGLDGLSNQENVRGRQKLVSSRGSFLS